MKVIKRPFTRIHLFFILLFLANDIAWTQTRNDKEDRLAQAAVDLLKLKQMQQIALFEFTNINIATLCIAIHTDYVLFTSNTDKSKLKNMQRFNFNVMGEAAYHAIRTMGVNNEVVQRTVESHSARLRNDPSYLKFASELCAAKADRLIYEDR